MELDVVAQHQVDCPVVVFPVFDDAGFRRLAWFDVKQRLVDVIEDVEVVARDVVDRIDGVRKLRQRDNDFVGVVAFLTETAGNRHH